MDSFFSQLAAAIEYELFKNGYVMKYSIYAGEMDVETFSNILAGTEVDGIIVMGRFFDEQLRATVEKMPNVVYVSLSGTESVNHDVVFSDAYKAARSVMGEFFRLGHRQIAHHFSRLTVHHKQVVLPLPLGVQGPHRHQGIVDLAPLQGDIAPGGDHRIIALWQTTDKAVGMRKLRCLYDLRIRCIRLSISDILTNRTAL